MILKIIAGAIALYFIVKYGLKFIKHKSLYPFMPFKYNFRRRRKTFSKVLKLLNQRNAKVIIETGTSRKGLKGTKNDGAGTIVFGKWAKENNAILHSVDISEKSIEGSKQEVITQGLTDVVKLYCMDSLEFLKQFNDPVDFIYLDSYDYSRTDTEIQRKSQEHHLKEFKLIEHKLHNNSIVLIDDCKLPGGGKGKTVVEYMLNKGWKILINSYQILLVKEK